MADFEVQNHGSVVTIIARSEAAKEHANEHFAIEGWQGRPENFTTDWRAGFGIAEQLAGEGWAVAA